MNVTDYTYLLNHPDTINSRHTDELDKIVAEFPYFQSARALRLKGLYNEDSFRYNFALKVCAAFTQDRSVLFDFITSDHFTAVEKSRYDQKQQELHAIQVTDMEQLTQQPSTTTEETGTAHMPWQEAEAAATTETDGNDKVAQDVDKKESGPLPDPATQSVLNSIKEAEQYAKSLVVEDVEEVTAEPVREDGNADIVTSTTETQEKLEIGKPLDFSANETHSFHEWLQLSQFKPIEREPEAEKKSDDPTQIDHTDDVSEIESERQKKNELIDRFIESNPRIPALKPESRTSTFIFEPSQPDNSYLMTETLARVYLEQKKFDKAIQAYEILILKYPEKSSFFADRILDIRNLQQNNK